jgi:hypothetical protein
MRMRGSRVTVAPSPLAAFCIGPVLVSIQVFVMTEERIIPIDRGLSGRSGVERFLGRSCSTLEPWSDLSACAR